LAELALHERVGSDHANIAGRLRVIAIDSQVEEALSEWHSKRVLAMAGRVALAVCLVQPLLLDRDVGRIPHYHMVLLPQNAVERRQCRGTRRVLNLFSTPRLPRLTLEVKFLEAPPVQ